MNRIKLAIAAAALAAGPAAAFDQPVQVNVEHLQPRLAQEIETRAAEGYTSLARYLERTRFIHRLSMDDVTQPKREAAPIERDAPYREVRKHAIEWR